MQFSDLPVNEKIDAAVIGYKEAIVDYIKSLCPEMKYEIDYEEAANTAHTEKAAMIEIHTEFGFVTIVPDFLKKSAGAFLVNRGMITAMELEGFDEEAINNAPIYSNPRPFSLENAEVFALILTNDLGLQHQKIILE